MNQTTKSVILRFLRGAIAGAVATMIPLLPQDISNVTNIKSWLISLATAAFIGFVTGLILAVDKAVRIGQTTNT